MKNPPSVRAVSVIPYLLSCLCLLLCLLVQPARATIPSGLTLQGANIYVDPVASTGGQSYDPGTDSFIVTGTGAGVRTGGAGFQPDYCHFAYSTTQYTGDVEIVARLKSFDSQLNGSQAGLMIRKTNAATEVNRAATWFFSNLYGNGTNYQAIMGSGPPLDGMDDFYNSGHYWPKPSLTLPYWMKLVRVGNNFGAYWSLDGRNWALLNNSSGGALFGTGGFNVGFFVSNFLTGSQTATCTAIFDNVYIGVPRLKYKTSWIGATSVGTADGNPSNQIEAMWVKPDGACYTNSNWDEGAEAGKIYKDGKVFHRFFGPGINGALEGTVTGNASNIFYYNGPPAVPAPAVYRTDFTTANPVQLTFTGTPLGQVGGLAASATRLFVSDVTNNLVRVVDLTTNTEITSPGPFFLPFALSHPGPIAYDGAYFWVVSSASPLPLSFHTQISSGYTPCIRQYTDSGALTGRVINDVTIPTALAYQDVTGNGISADDRLWVCDNGPNQNIRRYNNLYTWGQNAAFVDTFGQTGGIWATGTGAIPGKIIDAAFGGDKRFYGPVGVGTDSSGNIYVACNGGSGAVTDLRKFNSAGTLQWRLNGLAFLHNGDFDPASDGLEYYTTEKHFTLNYANTAPGSEWSYAGYTRDITKNANEGRNPIAPLSTNVCGVKLARLGTGNKLYMYTSGQGRMGFSWLYYFNGETAIPFGYNSDVGGHHLWIDANNNQTVDAGEEVIQGSPNGEAKAFDVDSAGDIWMACQGVIRHILNQGTQQIGPAGGPFVPVPKYSLNSGGYEDLPPPAPLMVVWNLNYDRTNDILYAVGKKADGKWALARCDQWRTNPLNKTDSVATWCVDLVQQTDITILYPPPAGDWAYFGLDVAGDKIFVAEIYGPIHVYDTAMGNPVIQLIQGPEVSARFGWDDMVMGVSAFKRSTGEYLVTEEGAGINASDLLYRWTPAADTAVTAASTALTATAIGRKVVLTWAGPAGMVTSYNLYRGTSSGGETLYQSGIKGPTFTDLNVTPGVTYYYKVTAVNAVGESALSNEANAMPVSAQAEFVKYDTTTQGTWKTVYGTDGYNIAGQTVNLPSTYLTSLTPVNTGLDYWVTDPTADVRALQMVSGSNRTSAHYPDTAGSWEQSWEMDFADDSTWHQVSIYLLDWTNHTQGVKVEVLVKGTTKVLDTRYPGDYNSGKWLVWNVCGDVTIRLTNAGGSFPNVSGVFFDPVKAPAPTTGWWKLDETSGSVAADSSGAGNHAANGNCTWTAGAHSGFNGCLAFGGHGYDSNFGLPEAANLLKTTMSLWFKTSTSGVLVASKNTPTGTTPTQYAPYLYVGTDNKLHGAFYTGVIQTMTSANPVNNNQWHHAALTSDGLIQTLYLDGEVAGMLVAPTSLLSYTTCGLGYVSGWPNITGPDAYLNGLIDDVKVYNRVLANSEIWKLAKP